MNEDKLIIGDEFISIEKIIDVSHNQKKISLSSKKEFREKIELSRKILEQKLQNKETIYGVTTGYGDSCVVDIPEHIQERLPLELTRYHQCGMGKVFEEKTARAITLVRIISLAQGYSAVRFELLEHMVKLFNLGVTPRIPEEGSVGASGDLTPLSYYAALLVGEGDAYFNGVIKPSSEIYQELALSPITLAPKEALALMNGTAVMTAIACEVFHKAMHLVKISSRLTAMSSVGLLANSDHFKEALFIAKPHKGTSKVASFIREDLKTCKGHEKLDRLQDRYSLRCAPHVIGVLEDAILSLRDILEIEINSANDNPLVDISREEVLHGGNFYGGHIGFLMDSFKVLIANVADLLDRQMALLVDTKFNNGLPSNLSASSGDNKYLSHGLKGLQISSSAWTAEALKNSLAASIFSRSTECHNQDKVSMGTISARDAKRSLELTYQVVSALALANVQAVELRIMQNELKEADLGQKLLNFYQSVREISPLVTNDRPLENNLRDLFKFFHNLEKGV